ncbi:MAG: hypothetical protein KF859_05775 [Phycisphaeraceae bacterium]|nr:hypothetical protein [Phycisphaeraceae bacterium]
MSEETRDTDGLASLNGRCGGAPPFPDALRGALRRTRVKRRVKTGLWLGPCLAAVVLLPVALSGMRDRGEPGTSPLADQSPTAGDGPAVGEVLPRRVASGEDSRPRGLTVVTVGYLRRHVSSPEMVLTDAAAFAPADGAERGEAGAKRVTPLSREPALLDL